jgi:hypothetical protein
MIAWFFRFLVRWRVRFLYFSAVLTLLALALMCWSIIVPHPFQVVVAMTVGQALGTLAFVMFGAVILLDLKKAKVLDEKGEPKG